MQTKKPNVKPKEEKTDNELDNVKIGLRIQQARNKKGITQEQLAGLVGCNTNYIGNLENGRNCPSLKMFLSLSKVLHVSIEYFLMDDPDIDPAYTLNPEMEKRSREMTTETRLVCLDMMDNLIKVQNRSFEDSKRIQRKGRKKKQ